jgi:AraC-like DNA-binding protein
LCAAANVDRVTAARTGDGIERIDARFVGHGYDPHRHDTYAVGLTLEGVQTYDYRGGTKASRPGQVVALYPDEPHDGRAGTPEGFRYRILYLPPDRIMRALSGRAGALPFPGDAPSDDPSLAAAVRFALRDLDREPEPLERDQMVAGIAEALLALDRSARRPARTAGDEAAVRRARELLDARYREGVTSAELEAQTGLDRFELARHFRIRLGTSPYRYLVLRRLDRARALMTVPGLGLADIAAETGFSDQSHLTRHFKLAFGITPGRWRILMAAGGGFDVLAGGAGPDPRTETR